MDETKKVRPLSDRIMVQREKSEKLSPGGIHIPDMAQEKTTIGVVLATGPGKRLDSGRFVEVSVKKGDRVIFGRYAGQEDRSQQDVIILRDDDILGVFE
jgi:chaperonin GroES